MNDKYDFSVPSNLFQLASKFYTDNSRGIFFNTATRQVDRDHYCEDPSTIKEVTKRTDFPKDLGERLVSVVDKKGTARSTTDSYVAYNHQLITNTVLDDSVFGASFFEEDTSMMNQDKVDKEDPKNTSQGLWNLEAMFGDLNEGDASNVTPEKTPANDSNDLDSLDFGFAADELKRHREHLALHPAPAVMALHPAPEVMNIQAPVSPPQPIEPMGTVTNPTNRLRRVGAMMSYFTELVAGVDLLGGDTKIGRYNLGDSQKVVVAGYDALMRHMITGGPLEQQAFWCLEHLVLAICIKHKLRGVNKDDELLDERKEFGEQMVSHCNVLLGYPLYLVERTVLNFVESYEFGEFHAYNPTTDFDPLLKKFDKLMSESLLIRDTQDQLLDLSRQNTQLANSIFNNMPENDEHDNLITKLSELSTTLQAAIRNFSATKFHAVQDNLIADYATKGSQGPAAVYQTSVRTIQQEFSDLYQVVSADPCNIKYFKDPTASATVRAQTEKWVGPVGAAILSGTVKNWTSDANSMLDNYPLIKKLFTGENKKQIKDMIMAEQKRLKTPHISPTWNEPPAPKPVPLSHSSSTSSYIESPVQRINF